MLGDLMSKQPIIVTAGPKHRQFATSAVAVQAIIINQAEEVVLLYSPTRQQGWQVVSGALEANETLLAGTLREIYEELGPNIQIRPLGTVHTETFHYDQQVQYMLSSYYLFAYQGGNIVPSDDMIGSDYRWWSMTELNKVSDFHSSTKPWILKRAIELYRLWVNKPKLPLQPTL